MITKYLTQNVVEALRTYIGELPPLPGAEAVPFATLPPVPRGLPWQHWPKLSVLEGLAADVRGAKLNVHADLPRLFSAVWAGMLPDDPSLVRTNDVTALYDETAGWNKPFRICTPQYHFDEMQTYGSAMALLLSLGRDLFTELRNRMMTDGTAEVRFRPPELWVTKEAWDIHGFAYLECVAKKPN